MKNKLIRGFLFMLCALLISSFSYAAQLAVENIIDDFQKATSLQKAQISADSTGKEISASGQVNNVQVYNSFDTANDVGATYYQVTTEQLKTKNNSPYQVIFLFKDKDKVKDLEKGQNIQKDGKIIRLEDERLQTSLWIFCGEITAADKILFK